MLLKTNVLWAAILCFAYVGFGQNYKEIDRLKQEIATSTDDSLKVLAYNNLAWEWKKYDFVQSEQYARKGLVLAKTIDFKAGEAESEVRLGTALERQGKYEEALSAFERSLKIEQEEQNSHGILRAAYQAGILLRNTGQFKKSVRYLELALPQAEELNNLGYIALILNELGVNHKNSGDYRTALKLLNKALSYHEELEDEYGIHLCKVNLGVFYLETGIFDRALDYFEESLAFFKEVEDTPMQAKCLNNLGTLFHDNGDFEQANNAFLQALSLEKENELDIKTKTDILHGLGVLFKENGQPEKAIAYYTENLNLHEEQKDEVGACSDTYNLGVLYFDLKQYQKALPFFQKSLSLATNVGNKEWQLQAMESLGEVYESLGQKNKALQYIKNAQTLEMEMAEQHKNAIISQLEYETLKHDNQIQSMWILGLIVFFILWCCIAFAVFSAYRNQQKRLIAEQNVALAQHEIDEMLTEQELKTTYARLEGQDSERQRIGKELHDGVGALLATIKLNVDDVEDKVEAIQTANVQHQQSVMKLVNKAIKEVRKLSHEIRSGGFSEIGLVEEIKALVEALNNSKKIQVKFNTHGLKGRLPNVLELNIYRMIQEMVNNTLKHAEAQKITIQLMRLDDVLNVIVEDNGKGFQVEEARKKGGMGLMNIRARVNVLNGTMDIDSNPKSGTTYSIDLPLNEMV